MFEEVAFEKQPIYSPWCYILSTTFIIRVRDHLLKMVFLLSREVEITSVNVVALSSTQGSKPRNCARLKETCTDISLSA